MEKDEAIALLFRRLCHAWTAGDAVAYGDCFTDDCDYVAYDGYLERGREPVVESHKKLFQGALFGSALVGEIQSIRYLRSDVAIVHGTTSVQVAWRRRLPKCRLTINTLVAVRVDDHWLFAAIHNGRIRPVGAPESDLVPARIARALVWAARSIGPGNRRHVTDAHLLDGSTDPVRR